MKDLWFDSTVTGGNTYELLEADGAYGLSERMDPGNTDSAVLYLTRMEETDAAFWMMPLGEMSAEREALCRASAEDAIRTVSWMQGYFFPVDMVRCWKRLEEYLSDPENTDPDWRMRSGDGYCPAFIIKPVPAKAFRPVREFIARPDIPRWKISVSLFLRISDLHRKGFTLHGFGRKQVRIDPENRAWLFASRYMTSGSADAEFNLSETGYGSGFLALPVSSVTKMKKNLIPIVGQMRDIFSAAVLAFYLIFYTHPYIGGAYWHLSQNQYLEHYRMQPEFIFDPDPENENALGNLDFEIMYRKLWEQTTPALRDMFSKLFIFISRPDAAGLREVSRSGIWDAGKWAEVIAEDEKTRVRDESLPERINLDMLVRFRV